MFRITFLLPALLSVALCALAQASPVASPSRRSEVHPIQRPAPGADLAPYPGAPRLLSFPNISSRVYGDAEWEVFSRLVNVLTCHAETAGRTWLGTALGLKVIDRHAGTVRHYTQLEGLPGDYVEAIATEGDRVWCSVLTTEAYQPVYSICRLDRSRDRWVVVRKLSWPNSTAATGSLYWPLPQVLAPVPGGICFVPPLRRSAFAFGRADPVSPALCIYHSREGAWEDVPWPPDPGREHPDLVLHAAHLDRNAAWLGTSAGLFRYDWRKRSWQLLSPGRPVLALLRQGDTVWAVRLPTPGKGAPTPRIPSWVLARGNLRSGEWSEMPPIDSKLFPFGWGSPAAPPLSLQVRGSTVWIAVRPDQSEALPVIAEFDEHSRRWYAPILRGERQPDLAVIPDAVLRDTLVPGRGLLAAVVPERFPGFICPEEHLSQAAVTSSVLDLYVPAYAGGGEWQSYEGALLHSLPTGGEETFRPQLSEVLIDPYVSQVFSVGGRLLAQTEEGVFELESPGTWRRLKLPLGGPGQEAALLADGHELWVGNAGAVMRCDPRTATLQVVASPADPTLRLLGVTSNEVWLTDPQNRRLFRCPAGSEEPELVAPPLPPELHRLGEGSLAPVAVAGGIVWYGGENPTPPTRAAVAGWNQSAGRWTAVHVCESSPSADDFYEVDGQVFVAGCHGRSVPVVAYDARTDSWSLAGPALPPSDNARAFLRMIAVTADRLWCVDQADLTVWELDRHAGRWSAFPCPDAIPGTSERMGVLAGDEIYLATAAGVRGLNITTHLWDRFPFRSRKGLSLDAPVASGGFVWCLGYGARTYVLRLSPGTGMWRKWELPDALPPTQYGMGTPLLIPDGPDTWVLFNGTAYRVEEYSETAVNLLASAAGEASPPQVRALVAAGPELWLVAAAEVRGAGGGPTHQESLLIRYDRESHRATRFRPPDGGTITAMLVEATTVWIGTTRAYYAFDKSTTRWQLLDVPLLGDNELSLPGSITRDGDDLWFGARDRSIRWKHSDKSGTMR